MVVDEVYSNTVFAPPSAEEKDKTKSKGEEERGYKSVLNLYAPLPPHVHVCWGFSKIFGVAGWRVGVLVSENRRVLDAVSSLLHPHEASTDTLHGLAALLETPEFSRQFLRELHVGLSRSFHVLADFCARAGVPLLAPEAGLYALVDLRAYLPHPAGLEQEMCLWKQMLEATNVNLTPGQMMHCGEAGWFRVCFASQPPEVLAVALQRLTVFLSSLNAHNC